MKRKLLLLSLKYVMLLICFIGCENWMAAFTYWKMFYLKTPSSLSTYYSPLLCIGLLHGALLSPVFASLHRVATSHFAQIIASWRRSPYFGLDAVSIQELVFSNDYRFYDRHDQPTVTSVSLLIFYASGYVEKFYILCKKYSGQDSKHDFIKIDQTSQERKQNSFVAKVTTWKKSISEHSWMLWRSKVDKE